MCVVKSTVSSLPSCVSVSPVTMQLKSLLKFFGVIVVCLYCVWCWCSALWLFGELCVVAGLAVIAWTLAYVVYDKVHTDTVDAHNKAVLITGCDSGFGHSLAQRLDQFGFHVFAGVLSVDGEGARQLTTNCSDRLRIVAMDVTKPTEVDSAVDTIRRSGLSLWAVVNNAGIAVGVPFDWGHDVDELRRVFEVNVFAVVRVTKACVPLLRESHGRVVNVASAAGRVSVPGVSQYCMAKHAVRAFSDAVRRELVDHHVSVVVIEPTFYRTPMVNLDRIEQERERIFAGTPDSIQAAYSEQYREQLRRESRRRINAVMRSDVSEVLDALQRAVTLKHTKLYYRCCGYLDVVFTFAASHLPEVLLDLLLRVHTSRRQVSTRSRT